MPQPWGRGAAPQTEEEEDVGFPDEAPWSAAACRRLSDSGCADLRRGGPRGGSKLQHSEGACGAR